MARIEATGRYMPETVRKNSDFEAGATMFESLTEFLDGYSERCHANKDETGLYMATKAAQDALSRSGHAADEVDSIIGWICPNQYLYGEDLNLIQHKLGALNASVLPLNTTCSSFLTALNLADSLIASGKKKCVLIVIATNWTSTILNNEEPNYSFAGDGAAAIVVDGEGQSLIDVCEINNSKPAVFQSMSMKNPVLSGRREYFTVTEPEGLSIAKDMVLLPARVGQELVNRNKDVAVDWVILHQSGVKMMKMWLDKWEIPFDRVLHTLDLYANMTAANLPVSLDYWVKEGKIQRGQVILFFAPAAGGHYISMLWRY